MDPKNPRIRSSVRTMSPYIPGEQPKMPDIVKLNTNENAYPPTPALRAVLDGIRVEDLRLYPEPDCDALRDTMAKTLSESLSLPALSPRNLFMANGSDEALRLCIDAFCEQDGSVGYVDPSYSLYPVLADIRGVAKRPVDMWPASPDATGLEWRVPEGYSASVFFLTNPNAPTGHLFDKAAVRAFCESFPGVVVIDEAYADFAGVSCIDLALSLPNVLVCRTFSKAYSLAGLRMGLLIGSEELMEALYAIKDSYNADRIAQAVARAAIADQAWMRGNVAKILATRERLSGELRARGWTVFDSATNFLWARPPASQKAADVFRHLREQAVIVRYWTGPRLCDYLRITVGTDAQIDRLLASLP